MDSRLVTIDGQEILFEAFPVMNNQLRTGADKGNPTVRSKQSIAMASDGVDTM